MRSTSVRRMLDKIMSAVQMTRTRPRGQGQVATPAVFTAANSTTATSFARRRTVEPSAIPPAGAAIGNASLAPTMSSEGEIVANNLTEYRGFMINASNYRTARGFIPTVVVAKHRDGGVTELRLSPPCPEEGVETEEQGFAAGFDYAKAAIDGRVPGIDVSKL